MFSHRASIHNLGSFPFTIRVLFSQESQLKRMSSQAIVEDEQIHEFDNDIFGGFVMKRGRGRLLSFFRYGKFLLRGVFSSLLPFLSHFRII